MKKRNKISLIGLLTAGVSLLGYSAVQAQINTGIEYGSATGLGGGDIRTIVGRIIQVFLGILGVIALVLIIYAGFLWMTAGGDEEKVARAKQIITQAVIGLAIVLSSFAITSFVVSRLVDATGAGGPGGSGTEPPGPLPTGSFTVQSITPPGSQAADFQWPKNAQIRVILRNGQPDPNTVAGSISVSSTGGPVSGTVASQGNVLIFTATAVCTENPSYTCLPGNSTINVTVAPTLRSTTGKTLVCGLCSATFLTSDLIDTQNPTVSIVSPPNGASVSVDSFVPVIADPRDDFAVAGVEFFANDVSLGTTGDPWQTDWETQGIPAGTDVILKATVTDAVGNTGLAQPVTVTVRPAHCFNNTQDGGETGLNCGDGCGACPGGACVENSDCASGLCVEGHCVNRPRIDSVTPLSGGPGTLVSIKGASFGSAPGEVMFLGTAAAGDEKVAAPCAPSAWRDTQVVVGVPEGAVTGPIQITNTDNLSDRTDDDFGNTSIPNFTVNTTVRPGICTLMPDSGPAGSSVVIAGNGFGDAQGSGGVTMAERNAVVDLWNGTQITMTAPNILGGTWPVTVTAGGLDSNSVGFTIPVAGNSGPHLLSIDPGSGPVGQYVTIAGTNFGTSPGTVTFTSGTYSAIGGVDFPEACGNNYWRDSLVTVKVPPGLPLGDVTVKLTRPGPVDSDNTLPFTIVAGNPSAGICRINPTAGPVGTVYEINGERLGNDRGRVVFRNEVDASPLVSSWLDSRISGAVPERAVTGQVYAVSAAASQSNPLTFNVADCRKAQVCTGAESCCDDGTCRSPNADGTSGCQAARLAASYLYRFSTGTIPLTPQVVEEISCSVRTQSPSPYKSTVQACANSVGNVRFTIAMDHSTLTASNFRMFACGTGDAFNAAACTTTVAGTVVDFGAGQGLEDGMEFRPAADLNPNEWYQGTILKTVASSAGINMNDDYVWHFRVRNSSDPCEIASVTVSPARNTLTDIYSAANRDGAENVSYSSYKANPANDVCNELDCTPYVWAWHADQSAAGIVNSTSCTPEVQALAETPVPTPANIFATAQAKTGRGELVIKFAPPQVIDVWPACQEACLNAQVAASFNVAVSNVSNQTVRFFTCNNETCASPTEVAGYTVSLVENGKDHLAVINPPGAAGLLPNQYYRVVVLGGANGVLSMPGAQLVKTNYVYGPGATPAYSWIFRTSGARCVVDRVDMSPSSIYTKIINSFHSVTAVPVSAPDSCSTKGQRLDSNGLGLAWSTVPNPPGAASLYRSGTLNVSPLAASYATSVCLNSGSVAVAAVCGNGAKERGEECDDANTNASDGCSSNCLLEGFTNNCGNGRIDTLTLGNGTVVSEQCDDGNATSGDGCSKFCLREGSTSGAGSTCGNNDVADNEQCDDGNMISGDGCSANCLDEGSLPGPFSVCGNSLIEVGEDCDVGAQNGRSGSGCSKKCLLTGTSACGAAGQTNCCGNGNAQGTATDAGEAPGCDRGWNAASNKPNVAEGCNNSCLKMGSSMSYASPSLCGDRVVGIGESANPDPGATGTDVDATQYAQAVGRGTTLDGNGRMISTINAATGGKNGQAEFALQCGFANDAACVAVDPDTARGDNSCCYFRPHVLNWRPQGNNNCRNPLIEVEFNREMNEASFAGKFTITGPVGSCPAAAVAVGSGSVFGNLWNGFSKLMNRIVAFVLGRSAEAQGATCTMPGGVTLDTREVNGIKHSFATYRLAAALNPNITYTATIDRSVKSTDGITLSAPLSWTFRTGTDICSLDAINVTPLSYLFSSQYSAGSADADASATFTATAVHLDAAGAPQPIAPINNVYAWTTGWNVSTNIKDIIGNIAGGAIGAFPAAGVTGATVTAGVQKATNGEGALVATATITADTINTTSTQGKSFSGNADLTIMICNDPWPARKDDNSWRPGPKGQCSNDSTRSCDINADCGAGTCTNPNRYNYSFYYCKDSADSAIANLPALKEISSSPSNRPAGVLDQYLYTYVNTLGSEGIGIRVAANPLHLSAAQWYASQGFKGKLKAVTVDGYDAIQDGSTTYVNAPALRMPGNNNYTDIFILSSSVGAGPETQNIFGQIIKNFRFAANRDLNGSYVYNDLNSCASNAAAACGSDLDCVGACVTDKKVCTNDGKTCNADADCASGGVCRTVCSNDGTHACTANADCSFGICRADRSKVRRDVKRLSDLRLIAEAASKTKDKSGAFPQLPSGSFIPGATISTWPSWTKEFATELGGTPPTDPLNKLAACPAGSDYEAGTCWSPKTQTAVCPTGSHAYAYSANGLANGWMYGYEPENNPLFFLSNCDTAATQALCTADPLCQWNGSCSRRYGPFCFGNVIGNTGAVCGNGVIESSEQCERSVNPTQTISCGAGNNGKEVDTCGADCRWIAGACAAPRCGNGIKETGEACDQGALNGTYNHCNAACNGIGLSCGDGAIQQGETCDKGLQNGLWHLNKEQSCSFDCHSFGAYCGNKTVESSNEQCDGNVLTTNDPAVLGNIALVCPDSAPDANGHTYKQARTNTCSGFCSWTGWGGCLPVGSCGNGTTDPGEQCDDGGGNSDTGRCLTSCKLNACGDAKVYSGREQCDEGAGNIDPADTGAINTLRGNCSLQSCYYCSTSCNVKAVSGAYCGDDIENGNEQCDDGTGNIDPNDTGTINNMPPGTHYCTNACHEAISPFCGDGSVDPGESCDQGTAVNNAGTSGCNSTCACLGEGYYSRGGIGGLPGLTVTSSPDYMRDAIPVQPSDQVEGWWPTVSGASPVWSGDAASTAHQYFRFVFTLNNPANSARLMIGADNGFMAWIDDFSGGAATAIARGENYLQPQLADLGNLGGSLTHTLYVEAWNVNGPAGLWFALVVKPQCADVVSIPVCQADGYTIYSDNINNRITSITNPAPFLSNPPPVVPPGGSINATYVTNPGGIWSQWPTLGATPEMAGSSWIWYAANANTYNGNNIANPETVVFNNSITVPGVPVSARINLLADDGLAVTLNGYEVCRSDVHDYCPTNNCASNQRINQCDITTNLVNGLNAFTFSVINWNTRGGLVYKTTLKTDCGLTVN